MVLHGYLDNNQTRSGRNPDVYSSDSRFQNCHEAHSNSLCPRGIMLSIGATFERTQASRPIYSPDTRFSIHAVCGRTEALFQLF